MVQYDAVVIGAGQAGPSVAFTYAGQGKRVAVVEMAQPGGTCLNHGCRPTKALRASAVVAHSARRAAEFGVHVGEVRVDFGQAIGRVHTLIDGMRASLQHALDTTDGLDYVHGRATLVGDPAGREHRVLVTTDAGEQELTTAEVFLNVGTRAAIPSIDGLDDVPYLTEIELLALTELPEHLVIVGGGYIGLEFGQMFRRFGSEVTIIAGRRHRGARGPRRPADPHRPVHRRGRHHRRPGRPSSVRREGGGVAVEVPDVGTVTGSHLLVATGRRSNTDLLGPRHRPHDGRARLRRHRRALRRLGPGRLGPRRRERPRRLHPHLVPGRRHLPAPAAHGGGTGHDVRDVHRPAAGPGRLDVAAGARVRPQRPQGARSPWPRSAAPAWRARRPG